MNAQRDPVADAGYAIRWPPMRGPHDVAFHNAVQWCVYQLEPDMWPRAKSVPFEPHWIFQHKAWEYVARELWAFSVTWEPESRTT